MTFVICRKFELLFSTGNAATYFGYGGIYYMGFVYNLLLFPTLKEFWKSVSFWESYRHYLVVPFWDTVYVNVTPYSEVMTFISQTVKDQSRKVQQIGVICKSLGGTNSPFILLIVIDNISIDVL